MPTSDSRIWPVLRVGVVACLLYVNATHFDATEIAVLKGYLFTELLGLKRKT